MCKKCLIFSLFFLATSTLCGQPSAEFLSLKMRLDTLRSWNDRAEYLAVLDSCQTILITEKEKLTQTELAEVLTLQATTFRMQGNLKFAIAGHQKALTIRENIRPPLPQKVASSHLNLGNCLLEEQKLTAAFWHLQQAETIKLTMSDANLVNVYNSLADYYRKIKDYETAEDYLQKVQQITQAKSESSSLDFIMAQINLANLRTDQNRPNPAIELLEAAFDLQKNEQEMVHPNIALIFSNWGNALAQKGAFGEAIEKQLAALIIYEKLPFELTTQKTAVLLNLGNHYLDLGNFNQAEIYLQAALKLAPNNSRTAAEILNSLGLVAHHSGQLTTAIKKFNEARSVFLNIPVNFSNRQLKAGILSNLGQSYLTKNVPKAAFDYFEQALDFYQNYTKNRPEIARLYIKMGKTQVAQNNLTDAKTQYQLAKKHLDAEQLMLQFILNYHLGELAAIENNWTNSETFFKTALTFLQPDSSANESLNWQLFPYEKIQIHATLGNVQLHLAQQSQQFDYWKKALENTEKALFILENLKGNLESIRAEINLQNTFFDIYNQAIEISVFLAKPDPFYQNKAFQYAERYRSSLLKKLAHKANIQRNSGIAANLILQENDLAQSLQFYQQQKINLQQKALPNPLQVQILDSLIFATTQQQQQLKTDLRTKHPEYFNFLLTNATPTLSDIQQRLQPTESVLLLQWSEATIWRFIIRRDTVLIKAIDNTSALKNTIVELGDFLRQPPVMSPLIAKENALKILVENAHELYNVLIRDVKSQLTSSLIVLPDGPLWRIPFDYLIEKPAAEYRYFKSHQYLLKNHAIQYQYATNFIHHNAQTTESTKHSILSIAPIFEREGTHLDSLKYNQSEVDTIQQLVGGDAWLNGEDSEAAFKNIAADYGSFHFSTHGIMDDLHPENSYLAFSKGSNPKEKGQLFVGEIYGLPLKNTAFVALSACQTANGQLHRGEGMLSLTHAFSYAGVPSLVASLWNVDDKQTPKLMHGFYQNMQAGMPKSVALQQAKLTYLEQAREVPAYPYFWAGFVLIGDDQPIDHLLQKPQYWGKAIAIFGLLLLGMLFYKKRSIFLK